MRFSGTYLTHRKPLGRAAGAVKMNKSWPQNLRSSKSTEYCGSLRCEAPRGLELCLFNLLCLLTTTTQCRRDKYLIDRSGPAPAHSSQTAVFYNFWITSNCGLVYLAILQGHGVKMPILLYRTGKLRLAQGPRARKWQSLLPSEFQLPHETCGHMGAEPRRQAHRQWVGITHSKSG